MLLAIMMLLVVSIAVTWIAYSNRERSILQLENASRVVENLIQNIIYDPMMEGDDEGTKSEFAFFAENYPRMQIYMSSFLDKTTYSTDLKAVDKPIKQSGLPPVVVQDAERALKNKLETSHLAKFNGKWYFSKVVSIENSSQCYHCHGASQSILGQLTLVRDVTPLMAELTYSSYATAMLGVMALALMVVLLRIFVRKVIIERLNKLRDASTAVTQGNLNADFDVTGKDELATLSENLGSMVRNIKTEMGFSKSILAGISVPYLIIDTEARVTACNKRILESFGTNMEPEDCEGVLLGDFTSKVGIGFSILTTVLETEKDIVDRPLSFTNLRGEEKHFIVTSSALYDLDGKLIGAFAIGIDITAIKQQQEAVEEQNVRITQSADSASEVSHMVANNSNLLATQIRTARSAALQILEQTQTSVDACRQMQESSHSVATKAMNASELAVNASSEVNTGRDVVKSTVQCIEGVMEQVNILTEHMSNLGGQANNVTNIISVIDEIADQTNLLALNAAIEAARAGEAGRGFAVVADEVRKLAEKTQEATKHVNESINNIVSGIGSATDGANKTLELMGTATEFSQQSGEALEQLHTIIENTAQNISIMAEAAHEQTATAQSMSEGVDVINTMSTNSADAMNVAHQAVKELDGIVQKLNDIILKMNKQ